MSTRVREIEMNKQYFDFCFIEPFHPIIIVNLVQSHVQHALIPAVVQAVLNRYFYSMVNVSNNVLIVIIQLINNVFPVILSVKLVKVNSIHRMNITQTAFN